MEMLGMAAFAPGPSTVVNQPQAACRIVRTNKASAEFASCPMAIRRRSASVIAERSMAIPFACGFGLPLGSRIGLRQE